MNNLDKQILDYISGITIDEEISDQELAGFYMILKETMSDLTLKTLEKCFFLVQQHPLTDAYVVARGDDSEPETLQEYQKILNNVKAAADRVKRNLKHYDKGETILGEDLSKFAIMRDQFSFYVTQLIYFVNASVHLQECAKTKPNNVYLREVIKALPAMDASLKRAKDSVVGWEKFGKGFDTFYEDAISFFAENSRVICACVKSVQETELKKQLEEEAKKPKMEVKQGKKVAPVESPAEQERKLWVKKANDLFVELQLDFMRDLEKQYSASTKDMYENFVNVKFKKFVETFQMPLSENTNIGRAKEVYGQIRKLIDYISSISENAYTISVYGDNE